MLHAAAGGVYMRPPGEVSQAVRAAWDAAMAQAQRPVPATVRDVAGWLGPQGVRAAVAHATVRNMARAGHLRRVGLVPRPGVNRGLVAYLPAWPATSPLATDPGLGLAAALRAWHGAGGAAR